MQNAKRRRPPNRSTAPETGTFYYRGKDGTIWLKEQPRTGRANVANVFRSRAKVPRSVQQQKTPSDFFFLFIDSTMIRAIIDNTNKEHQRVNGEQSDLGLAEDEFLAFLGLVYARGVLLAKNDPVSAMWSKDYGRDIFRNTMPRNRFVEILRYLRFDDKNTRTARKEKDRFCLIRDIWDAFVRNCQGRYNPSVYLTIDEQLFATQRPDAHSLSNAAKPGKFGIKFWLLADAEAR